MRNTRVQRIAGKFDIGVQHQVIVTGEVLKDQVVAIAKAAVISLGQPADLDLRWPGPVQQPLLQLPAIGPAGGIVDQVNKRSGQLSTSHRVFNGLGQRVHRPPQQIKAAAV